jgi:hypothetical protein
MGSGPVRTISPAVSSPEEAQAVDVFRPRRYSCTMSPNNRLMGWLIREWPYAGFLAGLLLLALVPLWVSGMGLVIGVIYLQLPVYMLHQLEEHAGDRFRRFVNDRVAGGRNALTSEATLVINVGGVWMVNVIALYLAMYVSPALGLISVYLTLVNAVVHVLARSSCAPTTPASGRRYSCSCRSGSTASSCSTPRKRGSGPTSWASSWPWRSTPRSWRT